jgi:hypothetical protein
MRASIQVRRELWKHRFYCWGTGLLLTVGSVEGFESILALLLHREPACVQSLIALIRAIRGS